MFLFTKIHKKHFSPSVNKAFLSVPLYYLPLFFGTPSIHSLLTLGNLLYRDNEPPGNKAPISTPNVYDFWRQSVPKRKNQRKTILSSPSRRRRVTNACEQCCQIVSFFAIKDGGKEGRVKSARFIAFSRAVGNACKLSMWFYDCSFRRVTKRGYRGRTPHDDVRRRS